MENKKYKIKLELCDSKHDTDKWLKVKSTDIAIQPGRYGAILHDGEKIIVLLSETQTAITLKRTARPKIFKKLGFKKCVLHYAEIEEGQISAALFLIHKLTKPNRKRTSAIWYYHRYCEAKELCSIGLTSIAQLNRISRPKITNDTGALQTAHKSTNLYETSGVSPPYGGK
jgi:hypothetical protein